MAASDEGDGMTVKGVGEVVDGGRDDRPVRKRKKRRFSDNRVTLTGRSLKKRRPEMAALDEGDGMTVKDGEKGEEGERYASPVKKRMYKRFSNKWDKQKYQKGKTGHRING